MSCLSDRVGCQAWALQELMEVYDAFCKDGAGPVNDEIYEKP